MSLNEREVFTVVTLSNGERDSRKLERETAQTTQKKFFAKSDRFSFWGEQQKIDFLLSSK
jgi:hypothetical protein